MSNLSLKSVFLIVSGRPVAFQTSRLARMSGRVATCVDRAGEFQPHQGAELEAMARAGGHHPALGGQLLDDETLVARHRVVADLQPVEAPALEASDQAAATRQQRRDLAFAGIAAAGGIAGQA